MKAPNSALRLVELASKIFLPPYLPSLPPFLKGADINMNCERGFPEELQRRKVKNWIEDSETCHSYQEYKGIKNGVDKICKEDFSVERV